MSSSSLIVVNTNNIADDAVTLAKLANMATDKIIGRSTAGTGDPELIDCTSAGRALLDDADASAQRTTLGLGTMATQNSSNVSISNGSITVAALALLTGAVGPGPSYSPTGTNVTNVSSSTIQDWSYNRLGTATNASGRFTLTLTSSSSATEFGISVPQSADYTLFTQLGGTAYAIDSPGLGAGIRADITNDRAAVKFVCGTDTANREWYGHFTTDTYAA